jgi:hypothetical protein
LQPLPLESLSKGLCSKPGEAFCRFIEKLTPARKSPYNFAIILKPSPLKLCFKIKFWKNSFYLYPNVPVPNGTNAKTHDDKESF